MKKLVLALLLVVVAIYGFGFVKLTETASNRFLDELESLSLTGRGEEYCARLHEDLKVSIRDHSNELYAEFEGGREEFCGFVTYAMKGVEILGVTTKVTRKDFTVTRDWLHPWTVHVTYHEDRTAHMSKAGTSSHTVSDDRVTLVQTFEGVKLLGLESRIGPAGLQ